ncbi:MAG: PQQ-binding-like beta-propeller repeat protein [Chthoniobacteraceae bacterium]|nr:PQQ-binding-like beta-propeller repeat protein [Chthoniobacteraceae bacterium]
MMAGLLHSRRDFLRGAAGLLLGAGVQPDCFGTPSARPSSGDFSFVVLSDLHYRDARCGLWLERVVAHVRALRPAPSFCVLDGDLADSGTQEQLGAVREIFRPLPMPLHPVIGNHDCTENGDRSAFEALFGKQTNYRFEQSGCQFLVLDSIEGRRVYRTRISQQTLGWVDQTLPQLSPQKPLIVLTHFPLGRNWLRPLNANALLGRLRTRNIQAVLSGHWHGLTERTDGAASLSTGRCCSWWRTNHDGSNEKGYVICTVRDRQVVHRFQPVANSSEEHPWNGPAPIL